MKRDKSITNKNIFVTSERKHTDTESGEYNYNISYHFYLLFCYLP